MPSTVYKGDLSEVAFGHESGMVLTHAHFTGGLVWSHATSGDISTISLTLATSGLFSGVAGTLAYPTGMLVGCMLRVKSVDGNAYEADDYTATGRQYTVIANTSTTLQVTPALATAVATNSQAGDSLIIDALACPAPDPAGTVYNANAATSDESVLTDQFVGLAATVSLPETKVELLRSHVVGVGRDVVVQVPQKFTNEGGSLETMMHSARWLYYALGNEATSDMTAFTGATTLTATSKAIAMGDNFIETDTSINSLGALAVGDYIQVVDTDPALIPTDRQDPAAGVTWTGTQTLFSRTETNEVRRVIAVDTTVTADSRVYVDDPFNFDHDSGKVLIHLEFANAATNGSPNFDTTAASFGNIDNRVSRMLFSGWHTPSFSLEASMRTRDVGSYTNEQSNNAPGGVNDSKQLTRVWKGCKVKDWTLTADADAEAKLSINFDALHCYTDTGRLETGAGQTAGDRYTAHRMFENIGNGLKERKEAGIAPNTEKPFLFYNGSITAFGQTLAQVTNFSLSGNNNTTTHYTVRGNPLAEARADAGLHEGKSLEQVPFGGSRNAALIVEGKVEYELGMTIIVSDPLLWHEFRTNRERTHTEPITLTLTKGGAGANREQVIVIIDDYLLTEAPLPIPDDKGVVKSELKIMPKHVKVVAHDTLFHC